MEIIKENINCYSSDYNKDAFIFCDNDGFIHLNDNLIKKEDDIKKYVKFYPSDNLVFTTTDLNGLKVWNSEKRDVIFSYKREELKKHAYSNKCLLTSFDDYNIKFYDLRCRYSTNSIKKSFVEDIYWQGLYLYVFSDQKLLEFDSRNLENSIEILNGVKIFTGTKNNIYAIKNFDKENFLLKYSKNQNLIKKPTDYEKIIEIKNSTGFIGLSKKQIKIEDSESIHPIAVNYEFNSVSSAFDTGESIVCFANNDIIKINKRNDST